MHWRDRRACGGSGQRRDACHDSPGQLQQSLDAVAIEVERIGESQRFSARLAAERVAPPR